MQKLCITLDIENQKKQTNMKKFLTSFVLLAALIVMPANAQVKFGVKGGMNSSSMKIDINDLNDLTTKNGYGWFAGLTLKGNIPLGLLGLGADVAALYDERSSKAELNGIEESIKQKSIIIPINARLNFNLLKLLGLYVATGPQFGFNVGNNDYNVFGNNSNAAIDNVKSTFQLKKSQFSWNIGAGAMIMNHLEIGVAYNFAIGKTGELKDMTRQEIIDTPKQKSLVVSAAYYF